MTMRSGAAVFGVGGRVTNVGGVAGDCVGGCVCEVGH